MQFWVHSLKFSGIIPESPKNPNLFDAIFFSCRKSVFLDDFYRAAMQTTQYIAINSPIEEYTQIENSSHWASIKKPQLGPLCERSKVGRSGMRAQPVACTCNSIALAIAWW